MSSRIYEILLKPKKSPFMINLGRKPRQVLPSGESWRLLPMYFRFQFVAFITQMHDLKKGYACFPLHKKDVVEIYDNTESISNFLFQFQLDNDTMTMRFSPNEMCIHQFILRIKRCNLTKPYSILWSSSTWFPALRQIPFQLEPNALMASEFLLITNS